MHLMAVSISFIGQCKWQEDLLSVGMRKGTIFQWKVYKRVFFLFSGHSLRIWHVFIKGAHPETKLEVRLQMKTFSAELAECFIARIPPKITLYGRLLKYNYEGCLQLWMFSTDLLFAIKRDAYIFNETGWFCRFPKHQKLDKWAMAAEKRQTCWPKLHTETEYESQLTPIL